MRGLIRMFPREQAIKSSARLNIWKPNGSPGNVGCLSFSTTKPKIIEPCLVVFKRINPLRALGSSGQLETRLARATGMASLLSFLANHDK